MGLIISIYSDTKSPNENPLSLPTSSKSKQLSRNRKSMDTSSDYFDSIAHQFPQPSWPSQADCPTVHEYCRFSDDLRQILRESVDEVDERGFEMFKKLVSKVEEKVPIERLFKETLHDLRESCALEVFEKFVGKLNCRERKDRDAGGDILTASEGEEVRVERFKVKTVNVPGVGVVKEDGK